MAKAFTSACVTGGAGFIGSHLVRALFDRGLRVRVIDDLSVGQRENVPDGVDLIVGNIMHHDVAAAAADVDVVFHLAARVAIRSSFEYVVEDTATNLTGTASVLRSIALAPRRTVKRFVLASSMAVYADSNPGMPMAETHATDPISPYGISKLAAEQLSRRMCEQIGIDSVSLRLFNTYGPGQVFSPYVGVVTIFTRKLLAAETPTIFGDGEQQRDFVHVQDVVQGFLGAMDHAPTGRVYNIGSGQGLTVNEVYKAIQSVLGVTVAAHHKPPVPGELRYSIADINQAKRALGYMPLHKFQVSIADIVKEIERS